MKIFLLILLLHYFADFTLQKLSGLHNFKQKDWWDEELNKTTNWTTYQGMVKKYGKDYLMGMFCHCVFWALVTFAPIIYLSNNDWFIIGMLIFNTAFHFIVDDLKANWHRINLIQDQNLHLVQIALTFAVWRFVG